MSSSRCRSWRRGRVSEYSGVSRQRAVGLVLGQLGSIRVSFEAIRSIAAKRDRGRPRRYASGCAAPRSRLVPACGEVSSQCLPS